MANVISQAYAALERLASSKLNALVSAINAHNHGSTGAVIDMSSYAAVPTLPAIAPTNDNHATRKKYTDDKITADIAADRFTSRIRARIDGAQTLARIDTGGAFVKVDLDAEDYDIDGEFASGTFVPASAGTYHVSAGLGSFIPSATDKIIIYVCKGTGTLDIGDVIANAVSAGGNVNVCTGATVAFDVVLSVGDKIEVWGAGIGLTPAVAVHGDQVGATHLSIHRIA